mmetsp:Transcript_17415/g.40885  ORF Transcript_17415/g.40885 Transcript_17415/m.40885 type:complete len:82 (+) Transcript_17415:1-246(+)
MRGERSVQAMIMGVLRGLLRKLLCMMLWPHRAQPPLQESEALSIGRPRRFQSASKVPQCSSIDNIEQPAAELQRQGTRTSC